MADPLSAEPEEARLDALPPRHSALALLRRRDFRRVYLAVSASELGDALQYIALMWFAFEAGGPLGVLAVRLADSVPALVFGLHGGLVADRWDRRKVLIGADIVRAAVLVPVAAAGLTGALPLWGLVVAALSAKKVLTGRKASNPAATAQPPTESASAVARTSPFACWTLGLSTRLGRSAP